MKTIRLLILEDDIETLAVLLKHTSQLENELLKGSERIDIAVTVLSEYPQVQQYVNNLPADYFDVVLLDRDCKAAGSFHVIDIEKIGPEKFISISSTPPYNDDAQNRGIKRVVHKDYSNLEDFTRKVIRNIKEVVNAE